MATGSHQNSLVAQGSDDVFEKASTKTDKSQTKAGHDLTNITTNMKSLDDKESVSSEKGQRARNHFRSSGYGTNSSENISVNSVSHHCSSSLPEEVVPAATSTVPQSNQIFIPSTEASDCVENDFKPKNLTSVSSRMNILANSTANNSPNRDSERPPQVNPSSNNVSATAFLQSTRTADNMTAAGIVPSNLTTENQEADTGQGVSDINQQRSPDHCLMLNTEESHAKGTYSQNVQVGSDLIRTNDQCKTVSQLDQTQAHAISQATSPHQQKVTTSPHQQTVAVPSHQQTVAISSHQQTVTTSPHQQTVTTPPHQQTVAAPSHQQTVATPSHQQTVAISSHQQTVVTPSHQQTVVTHSHQQTVAISSHQQTVATPSHQQTVATPSHQQTVATPSHQQTVVTPSHQQTVATPSHQQTVIGNESASADVQRNISADLSAIGYVEDRQPHMSSAADSSINHGSQNFKSKHPLIRQNVLRHQTTETENWNPASGYQNMFSDNMSTSTFYLSSDLSLCQSSSGQTSIMSDDCGCRFDLGLMGIMDKCARCKEACCENPECVQIRKIMMELQDMKRQGSNLTEYSQVVLQTMAHHVFCGECTRPRCFHPWCGETIESGDQSLRHIIMKQQLENYAEYCRLSNSSIEEYMKLSLKFPYDSMPVEGQDWQRLIMLGNSRRTFLAVPLASDLTPNLKYWVIKKIYRKCDYNNWNVYYKLRDVQHSSIASMLWAAKYESHLLVGYVFENLSLLDCLRGLQSRRLGLGCILNVMVQLTSAANHLHDLGIVYLYWISKNIQVEWWSGDDLRVKICNFSCSACLDSYDGGQLYLMLPAEIVMPELRNEQLVELSSDVWGLGCLLNELVTGKPVWHEYRHLLDVDLHVQLGENPVPETPKIYPELLSLFQACWEVDLAKRASTNCLRENLSKLIRT